MKKTSTKSAKEILERLDDLFEEAIIKRDDDEVLKELDVNPNIQIKKHLDKVKFFNKQHLGI